MGGTDDTDKIDTQRIHDEAVRARRLVSATKEQRDASAARVRERLRLASAHQDTLAL